MPPNSFSVIFFTTLLIAIANGKVIEGEIDTNEVRPLFGTFLSTSVLIVKCSNFRPLKNWAFLTRFCFLSKDGKFLYKITYPKVMKCHMSKLQTFKDFNVPPFSI